MTYRFLLTFVVGASIVMTLVGRGQVNEPVLLLFVLVHLITTFVDRG
jgi:hypothetical protein